MVHHWEGVGLHYHCASVQVSPLSSAVSSDLDLEKRFYSSLTVVLRLVAVCVSGVVVHCLEVNVVVLFG